MSILPIATIAVYSRFAVSVSVGLPFSLSDARWVAMTPSARSKKYLEQQGYRVRIVEHWNSFAKCRVDLFGLIDLIGMKPGSPLLAIQTTVTVKQWLATGNAFQFHGWDMRGPKASEKRGP